MKSVWEQTGEHRDFAPLKGDISTDVLIIGGGMAGAPICCTAPEYPMF
jgi:glycerol-3-phosphate dehydrogenase